MAYRLTYQVQVDWIGPGLGPMGGALAPVVSLAPAGGGQTLQLNNVAGGQNSQTFTGTDVTNLTNAMAADIAAQLNVAATLARIQAFSTGTG
jgi:hypothetical protein